MVLLSWTSTPSSVPPGRTVSAPAAGPACKAGSPGRSRRSQPGQVSKRSLLEFAEEGALTREILSITGELAFGFSSFWSVVAHRRPQRPDLKLPLFHTRSDGFWQPLDEQMQVLRLRDLPAFIRFDAAFLLARMQGRKHTLPANPAHRPAPQHLGRHRSHKYQG